MRSGSEALSVRVAREEDAPALVELYEHLVPTAQSLAEDDAKTIFRQLLLHPGSAIFLGIVSREPVSTCTLIVVPNLTRGGTPYALIENVVTHSDFRGRGFGKAVLQAAVEAAWGSGCYKTMLLTGSQKLETLAFYRSAGFENTKTGFEMRRVPRRAER